MLTWYAGLKVLHILSAVVWIGGSAAFTAITSFLVAAGDRATIARLFPQTIKYGQRAMGPASILVLLTGIGMVLAGRIGFNALWVSWGFGGILVHFVYGATVMRKRAMAFVPLLTSPTDDARVAAAGRRLIAGNAI